MFSPGVSGKSCLSATKLVLLFGLLFVVSSGLLFGKLLEELMGLLAALLLGLSVPLDVMLSRLSLSR